MKRLYSQPFSLVRLSVVAVLATAALSGCYVVPLHTPPPQVTQGPVAVTPAAPVTQTFAARLYPSNAEAATYGTVVGTVTNDLNGRGYFSAVIGGEQFQGEATRVAGSGQRSGVANASGTRGGILSCRYTMNSSTLGTGSCVLNNGPAFTMHVGG